MKMRICAVCPGCGHEDLTYAILPRDGEYIIFTEEKLKICFGCGIWFDIRIVIGPQVFSFLREG
ncbi:MAG: hypothetical protein FWC67_03825 [Defluviitaleaceae bacterium]|nr:hypothetical protein [Defluviitaleaceae bacterium]